MKKHKHYFRHLDDTVCIKCGKTIKQEPTETEIFLLMQNESITRESAIQLLKETGRQHIIDEVYAKSKAQEDFPKEKVINYVTEIYEPFTQDEISRKIAQMLTPPEVDCPVELVYQTIEGLHKACPNHTGDWYFSGIYPTPGGNRLVNKAFINYYEGLDSV